MQITYTCIIKNLCKYKDYYAYQITASLKYSTHCPIHLSFTLTPVTNNKAVTDPPPISTVAKPPQPQLAKQTMDGSLLYFLQNLTVSDTYRPKSFTQLLVHWTTKAKVFFLLQIRKILQLIQPLTQW